ncbi:MAG: HD domain-containing protein [Rhodanobacteraceae bacterium]
MRQPEHPDEPRAGFAHMRDGTAGDWQIISGAIARFAHSLPDRVLGHLQLSAGDYGGFAVDRLTHGLQTATLAYRDGQDEEYVVCALLHDMGDTLGTYNHADVAASIVQPFVSEENYWMVKHHAIFQGYYFFDYLGLDKNLRDQYRDHPHYRRTLKFCTKYDAAAFDPAGETLPLSFFEPMVRRVMAAPKQSLYQRSFSREAAAGGGT